MLYVRFVTPEWAATLEINAQSLSLSKPNRYTEASDKASDWRSRVTCQTVSRPHMQCSPHISLVESSIAARYRLSRIIPWSLGPGFGATSFCVFSEQTKTRGDFVEVRVKL